MEPAAQVTSAGIGQVYFLESASVLFYVYQMLEVLLLSSPQVLVEKIRVPLGPVQTSGF